MAVVLLVIFVILWAWGTVTTLLRQGLFGSTIADFLICAVAAVVFMSLMFVVAKRMKRYDLIDVAWGLSFITIALTSFFLQNGPVFDIDVKLLVTVLVITWGSRLAIHIGRRIKNTSEEDPRYVEIRKKWKGNVALKMYSQIYLLQAALALAISIPVIYINLFHGQPSGLGGAATTALVWLGFIVWVVGFVFEKTADDQLRSFIADKSNKGKLMTEGVWKYSRHPNYFGELTQWWGIFIICLSGPYGWIGVIGPVLISYLILFVSGVPLSEKRFEGRDGWDAYKRRTSVLIPLPPKS